MKIVKKFTAMDAVAINPKSAGKSSRER